MAHEPCKKCGHELWSEIREVGSARFLVHFDDDERSYTYAEHSPDCPGCGVRLDLGGISGARVEASRHLLR